MNTLQVFVAACALINTLVVLPCRGRDLGSEWGEATVKDKNFQNLLENILKTPAKSQPKEKVVDTRSPIWFDLDKITGLPSFPNIPSLTLPSTPSFPNTPGSTISSSWSGFPSFINFPSIPGFPIIPSLPSTPGSISSLPSIPSIPSTPGSTSPSSKPGFISFPTLPTFPGFSSFPNFPVFPSTPGTINYPGGQPGILGIPGLPGIPGIPGNPYYQSYQGFSGVHGITGFSCASGFPGLSSSTLSLNVKLEDEDHQVCTETKNGMTKITISDDCEGCTEVLDVCGYSYVAITDHGIMAATEEGTCTMPLPGNPSKPQIPKSETDDNILPLITTGTGTGKSQPMGPPTISRYPNNGFPSSPNFPSFPDISSLPDFPSFPDFPISSGFPNFPGFPSPPDFPGYLGFPSFPDFPNFPDFPTFPDWPSSPTFPSWPSSPTFQGWPSFPSPGSSNAVSLITRTTQGSYHASSVTEPGGGSLVTVKDQITGEVTSFPVEDGSKVVVTDDGIQVTSGTVNYVVPLP